MLFVFVAQVDAAASCAASCGRGTAAAALRSTVCASLLGCRYSYVPDALFFVSASFFGLPRCRTCIPTCLLNFGGVACRISFTSSANTP